jgi:hypothetical protein
VASRWALTRAAVSAAVEALVPETAAAVTYHEAATEGVLSGVSANRAFWQDPPQAQLLTEQSSDTVTIRYSWPLQVILKPQLLDLPDRADACVTEPLNISRALMVLAPTTGAQPILVTSWSVSAGESTDEQLTSPGRMACGRDHVRDRSGLGRIRLRRASGGRRA